MQNTTTDNVLRIGDFSIYQLRADDIFSYVVWDHHNGAHMTNAKGDQEFGLRGARDLAREYEFDAPAARPTYLGS
jgi:hypothetical protein